MLQKLYAGPYIEMPQPYGQCMKDTQVVSAEALAEVLDYLLSRYGTHEKAAAALNIKQPHFTRLLHGRAGRRVRTATANRLRRILIKWFKDDPVPLAGVLHQLDLAILGPEGVRSLAEYEEWLTWWFRGLRNDRGSRLIELRGRLRRHKSYGSYFTAFEDTQEKRGYLPTGRRVMLAELRVVSPLLDSDDTAGIEQGWEELNHSKTLGRYLKSALTAESVLLDRVSASERAREVAS